VAEAAGAVAAAEANLSPPVVSSLSVVHYIGKSNARQTYKVTMLRLTLLAPDIIESILNGADPDGLSLEKLYRMPVGWEEQRQLKVSVLGGAAAACEGR
jgi:hypothetical protein